MFPLLSDEKGAYYFHVKSGTTQYEPPSPDFDKQQRAQSSNEVSHVFNVCVLETVFHVNISYIKRTVFVRL